MRPLLITVPDRAVSEVSLPDLSLPGAAAAVHARLKARGETVASAESLTGGELAAALSSTAGASTTFLGGVVTYATELKVSLLGVTPETVATYGVVSAACAEQMAAGALRLSGATWALATTGVAGPDPQEGKLVGTVFLGLAGPDAPLSRRLELEGDRTAIRGATCAAALALLAEALA